MSGASIEWSVIYDAGAGQTTTVTLAGEISPAVAAADYTILVQGVTLADYISYSGAYGATLINNVMTKVYPLVTFDLPGLVANAGSVDADLRNPGMLNLVAPNGAVPTLAGLFKNSANEFTMTGETLFGGEYPIEAIVGVTFTDLVADDLLAAVGGETASDAEGSAPVILLENLLAAGKVSAATLNDGGGTGRPTFSASDALSVFVRYTLDKTREFEMDGTTGLGTPAFALNGTTLTAGKIVSETSQLVKVVEWRFIQ
jgi:hypothetical protein